MNSRLVCNGQIRGTNLGSGGCFRAPGRRRFLRLRWCVSATGTGRGRFLLRLKPERSWCRFSRRCTCQLGYTLSESRHFTLRLRRCLAWRWLHRSILLHSIGRTRPRRRRWRRRSSRCTCILNCRRRRSRRRWRHLKTRRKANGRRLHSNRWWRSRRNWRSLSTRICSPYSGWSRTRCSC